MRKVSTIVFILGLSIYNLTAHPAWGIVVDEHKNIYFADIGNLGGTIWKLSDDGNLTSLITNFHSHNVSLDNEGNVIAAHGEENHTMLRFNKDNSIDTLYHTTDLEEFFGGNCTWSQDGRIIYGLGRHKYLRSIDKNGNQKPLGDYQFKWNQTVYCAPDGTIYAPDIGVGNGIVVKINTNGASQIIAEDLITKLDRPKDKHNDVLLGITKGCDGLIYIAENAGHRIIKILENGKTETFYRSKDEWFPTGIDFFAGDAYILEFKHIKSGMARPRITKIDESGNITTLFNYETYKN